MTTATETITLHAPEAMPPDVNVAEIAEDACQVAFALIAERLKLAGYGPVTGDFAPDETVQLDKVFALFVRSMAFNSRIITGAEWKDGVPPASEGATRWIIGQRWETDGQGVTEVHYDDIAEFDGVDAYEALARYSMSEGFADPREFRGTDEDFFYVLADSEMVGMVITNYEVVARPAARAES